MCINLGDQAHGGTAELERSRAKLRPIDGEKFAKMLLENQSAIASRHRSLIPPKRTCVPALSSPRRVAIHSVASSPFDTPITAAVATRRRFMTKRGFMTKQECPLGRGFL